jgi:hypothetical protein
MRGVLYDGEHLIGSDRLEVTEPEHDQGPLGERFVVRLKPCVPARIDLAAIGKAGDHAQLRMRRF